MTFYPQNTTMQAIVVI